MAIINYTDQIKYAGKGYLDAKMMPVNSVDDLKAISLTQRFEGLTITVLNNGNPQDYWLVGGITNNCWVPKTTPVNTEEIENKLDSLSEKVDSTEDKINENKIDINLLKEKIESLNVPTECPSPDGETIGSTEGDENTIYVKILNKDGNFLKKEYNDNGESGLYAAIPIYYEDDEL